MNTKKNINLNDYEKYYTQFNGSIFYAVYIKDNEVLIYKNKHIYQDNPLFKFYKKYKTKKIFIGKDDGTSEYSVLPSPGFFDFFSNKAIKYSLGNSILLNISKNKYVFIGDIIIDFITENDEIYQFDSIIGPNDVPYPTAIGEKFIYGFGYPQGYISIKEFPNLKLDTIHEKGQELDPFFKSLTTNKLKQNLISLKEFKEIQKKPIHKISLNIIKKLCKIYTVPTDGSKKELVDRIENLRSVVVYNKNI